MIKLKKVVFLLAVLIAGSFEIKAQNVEYDTSKVHQFDMGKLWTFDEFPNDYLKEKYNLKVSDGWVEDVRLSALKFASWCSASFVSEDGLIMTNHHCIDFVSNRIQKDGEDVDKNGFYAPTLQDERRVPGLFVDQLVLIKDITGDVNERIAKLKNCDTIVYNAKAKDDLLITMQTEFESETGLQCVIVPFYSGAKYSLYGYKRYPDIRAVYFNEASVGLYGGDPDNFTFPRYNADFAFLRAYDENGVPAKIDNYFAWSKEGPMPEEPIFVVGNPGKTQRLKTVAQIEQMGKVNSKNTAFAFERLMKAYYELLDLYPNDTEALLAGMGAISNSAKVYIGEYKAIINPNLLVRKRLFESEFKSKVQSNKELNEKYGHLWKAIADLQNELNEFGNKKAAYNLINRTLTSNLSSTGLKVYLLAKKLKSGGITASNDSLKAYIDKQIAEALDNTKNMKGKLKAVNAYDEAFDIKKLGIQLDIIKMNLGAENEYVKMLMGDKDGEEAAKLLMSKSIIFDEAKLKELFYEGADKIINCKDPVLYFISNTREDFNKYSKREAEIKETESALELQLGEALFAVYGSKIPPDATFTLRINDGVLQGYEYNGTIAPKVTTFYGMFDRYYSFNKKFPWDLPERWSKPNPNLDLSTPYNFVTTNDITGGSSGSPIINKNAEIIGIAFDGNIESLAGDFLYDEKSNRCVGVTSQAILEIIGDIGGAERIRQELLKGKISE